MCTTGFEKAFGGIRDPRTGNRKVYSLTAIMFMTMVGVMCGMRDFVAIADFAKLKRDFFTQHLPLPDRTPSHDVFGDVFAIIDTGQFYKCFEEWTSSLREVISGDYIAFDGKSVRSCLDKKNGGIPLHLMNVWSDANGICLAQMCCDTKSNEVVALESLLKYLSVGSCVVSADAMHCHKKTTEIVREAGADYVLGLKKNEKKLYQHCEESFSDPAAKLIRHQVEEKGHGRKELRVMDLLAIEDPDSAQLRGWQDIRAFARVTSTVERNSKKQTEVRYYIASLTDKKRVYKAIRHHWGIENKLHWVLDEAFREDRSRARSDNAGENLATMRKIVLNILSKIKIPQFGYSRMMLRAALDNDYLRELLQTF
jgi:predicted transposase YbfD/YdcC